jgi:hypothetical protein
MEDRRFKKLNMIEYLSRVTFPYRVGVAKGFVWYWSE